MRPMGYMYKRVAPAPEWLTATAPHVTDVYALSDCVSDDFADYINFWRHNGYWLFDSPAIIVALAAEHGISLERLKLFYYEIYELEYHEESAAWESFEPWKDFVTEVQLPVACTLEGFDVVTFSQGTTPECSPLSCNGLAATIATNAHCLMSSQDAAIRALENGVFNKTEPGPFSVIAVYSVDGA
jgi:hypothetical protein